MLTSAVKKTRPRPLYLNLLRIRLPLPGVVSILHRLSGVLLFVATPVLLWMLEKTLESRAGFDMARSYIDSLPAKLVALVLIWALWHHLLAGVRFLFLDLQIGIELVKARASAWAVIFLSAALTAYCGWRIW